MQSMRSWRHTARAAMALALVWLAAPSGRLWAQGGGTGSVGGTVTDERGAPVSGVQVTVISTGRSAVTIANGSYVIEGAPTGAQQLRVRLIGYRGQTKAVTVAGGQRITENFSLEPDPLNLEAVVVTGNETPRTHLETSNASTVLSAADITQAAPRSTTEVLRYVPGFTRVESSGGEVNENITMRGILGVEYVMFMEDGLPVFPTMHTFFMNADNLFRMDENVERVEVVRGAGSALFGSNTPGAIVNIINKTGGPDVRGSIMAYGGTGQLARTDFNVNGPIGQNQDWTFDVGGYYRYDRGVRDPGFPGTEGGQLKASLTRNFNNGFFRTSLKIIDDRNQFILDLPFSGGLGSSPQYVPGFSNYGSMNTNEGNGITVPTPDGQLTLPLSNGLRTKAYWLTASAGFNLAKGWNIENSAQIMQNQQEWNAILPFDAMTDSNAVNQYLTSYWASYAFGVLQKRGVIPAGTSFTSAALVGTPTFTLTYPNVLSSTGSPTAYNNPNGLLAPGGEWHVSKPIAAFQDQLTFKKALEGGHNVSLGIYFANYTQQNNWYFTDILTDIQDNPHFVDLTVNNATVRFYGKTGTGAADSTDYAVTNFAATKGGFRRFVSNYVNGTGQTTVFSTVLGGSFKLSEKARADLGIRYENDNYVQTSQNTTSTPVAGDSANSLNLVNQDAWGVPGSYKHFARDLGDWAGSLGLNYALSGETSVYALGSRAYKMPALDEFLNASAQQQVSLLGSKRNWTAEIGVKHDARNFQVTADGFYTVLKDIVSQGLVLNTLGQSVWIIQANPEVRSYGVEVEASGHLPNTGFGALTNWTLLRAEYASCPTGAAGTVQTCPTGADVGTLLSGVPPIVGNLALTFEGRSGFGVDADFHFVDRRCTSAIGCTNKLPTYAYLNLGAQYLIPSNGITIRADVLNATQSIGLEEGNPRLSLVGGFTSSLFLARPILPRALLVSMGYRF